MPHKDRRNILIRVRENTNVDPETECWLWTGKVSTSGYAVSRWRDRVVYEAMVTKIPEGRHLHHRCNVRHCLNPSHLQPVTPARHLELHDTHRAGGEAAAKIAKARTACRRGHEYTPENTHTDAAGHRWCRACGRMRANRLYAEGRYAKQKRKAAA